MAFLGRSMDPKKRFDQPDYTGPGIAGPRVGQQAMAMPNMAPGMIGTEQPATPARKSGMGTRDIVGIIGDTLLGLAGQQGVYAPMMQRERAMRMQREQDLSDQATAQQAAWQRWVAQKEWERANPAPVQPTEFERQLDAAGFTPEQKRALLQQYAQTRAAGDPIVQTNADGTRTLYPRQMLFGGGNGGGGPPAQPTIGAVVADPRKGGAGSGPRTFP